MYIGYVEGKKKPQGRELRRIKLGNMRASEVVAYVYTTSACDTKYRKEKAVGYIYIYIRVAVICYQFMRILLRMKYRLCVITYYKCLLYEIS